MHKKLTTTLLLVLGSTVALVALFANALGLDEHSGWGRARTLVLMLGLFTLLLAGAYYRYADQAAAALRRSASRVEDGVIGRQYGRLSKRWGSLPAARQRALIFAGFLGFFLLLLLPVALSGSLLGSLDSLFGIALSNTFINRMRAALFGEFVGQAMYPADIARYGETGIGVAGLFILFRVAGANDVYAAYLSQAMLFSLMAFSMVLFAQHYTQRLSTAVFAGLVFSTTNFIWANVDDLVIHFYFLPLISAHFLKQAIEHRRARDLLAASIVGGLQVYLSSYVFIYQTMLLGLLLMVSFGDWWRGFSLRNKLLAVALYVLIPMPRVLFYAQTVAQLGITDVWPSAALAKCYFLQLPRLISTLPDKLIQYPFVHTFITESPFPQFCPSRHLAFPGLVVPALAILGARAFKRSTLELVLIALTGLAFALGSVVKVGERELVSPIQLFYEHLPMAQFLRIGFRSYTLSVLALSVLAAAGLERMQSSLARHSRRLASAALVLSLLVILAENISWPLNRYEIIPYPEIPDGYAEFFEDKTEALILDLPSLSAGWPGYIDEVYYLLWQTRHKRNILGGVFGYYPPSRVEVQQHADLLPSDAAFAYFRQLGVTHFVWHNSPHLHSRVPNSFNTISQSVSLHEKEPGRDFGWLNDSSYLHVVFHNDLITIYELQTPKKAAQAEQ